LSSKSICGKKKKEEKKGRGERRGKERKKGEIHSRLAVLRPNTSGFRAGRGPIRTLPAQKFHLLYFLLYKHPIYKTKREKKGRENLTTMGEKEKKEIP
jgi:hypothetical protein